MTDSMRLALTSTLTFSSAGQGYIRLSSEAPKRITVSPQATTCGALGRDRPLLRLPSLQTKLVEIVLFKSVKLRALSSQTQCWHLTSTDTDFIYLLNENVPHRQPNHGGYNDL